MNDKTISVIIPVYNSQDTIIRCVESILYGKLQNIEVILVEDRSQDDSWEICNMLAEKYEAVKCFQNSVNLGVSATRNIGLKQASGEYILFVDSDDWVSCDYAKLLLQTAEKNRDALVICGLHFINYVNNYKQDYIWDNDSSQIVVVDNSRYFELVQKFHIQQLWNKIFRREIIEKYSISFDESISMGEDFQFVLDYMGAICCRKCVILNQPLYYYTRTDEHSLMSQFGLNGLELEKKRLLQLYNIAGSEFLKEYETAISGVEYNHAYHVYKNHQITDSEKTSILNSIFSDGQFEIHLKNIKLKVAKERIADQKRKVLYIPLRLQGKIQSIKNKRIIKREKNRLNLKDIPTIISQNCIGGVYYHDMKMEFLSPTINLYFKAADFMKFISDLKRYISTDLRITWGEEYPIGYLDNVTIQFMHYSTCSEAQEAWNRRLQRMNWDNIVVFCTDMEGFSQKEFTVWKDISYPKVLFTSNPYYCTDPNTILIEEYKGSESVPDLIPKREFYASGKLIELLNDRLV